MKTCLIVNPGAGSVDEDTVGRLKEALTIFTEAELIETTRAEETEQVAREALSKHCELLVAAGGDGTVNAVVNGMSADFGAALLAVVPLGTGNDFARSLQVPDDPARALEMAAKKQGRSIDVIRVTTSETRYFINVSSAGYGGKVNENLSSEVKERWGPFAYLRSGVDLLQDLTEYEIRVDLDDGKEKLSMSAYNLVIANARYVAGGIPIVPWAELDDGLLDIMILPVLSMKQLAVLVPQILLGQHEGNKDLIVRRAGKVVIDSRPAMLFNMDGELAGTLPATFESIPKALRVVMDDPSRR